MAATARAARSDVEKQYLESLLAPYAEQGFATSIEPEAEQIPIFLGSYRPDAIALKPGNNVAIELIQRSGPPGERSLQDIRRLFAGHPDWRFVVAYVGSDRAQSLSIPAAAPPAIRRRMAEIETLLQLGQRRAAFIMAWPLLEASLHRLEGRPEGQPGSPESVVQALAMLGYVDLASERQLRTLSDLRNRIVHGDLDAEPTASDIELMLSVIPPTLEASAA